jgi:outer membrane receptor protein involved in Fe transport
MSHMRKIPLGILLSSATGLALLPQLSRAQTAEATSEAVIRDDIIVVTAQKREEDVQDVPASISVLGGEQIEKFQARQLSDFAAYMPGFQVDSGGSPGQAIVTLRGIGPVGPGQTVGTYIDDTPVGSSSFYARGAEFTLDMLPYDLERVEVLRGPQGTLYGASSIGGLIKYVLREPDPDGFSARAGAEIFDIARGGGLGWAARGTVNVPVIPGQLALAASYGRQHTPGYIDNVATGRKDQNAFNQQSGRVSLLWAPAPELSIQLGAMYQEVDSRNNGTSLVYDGPARDRFGDGYSNNNVVDEPFRKEVEYYSGTLDYDLGFAGLTSATSYSRMRTRQVQDATSDYGVLFPLFGEDEGNAPFALKLNLEKWTQEIRLASPSGPFEWLIGGFYTTEDSSNAQSVRAITTDGEPIAAIDPFAIVSLPSTYREYAVFGNVAATFGRFKLGGGLRYAHNSQKFRQITSGPLFDLFGGGQDNPGSSSEGVVTYSVHPQFAITDDVMLYARIASGYRPGGPNTILTGAEKPQVDSDRLVNYEAGIKSSVLDNRVTLNISAFYMDWKDIQVTVQCPGVTGCSFLDNAGTAESKGFEMAALVSPARGLTAGLNISYTDARLTEDAPGLAGFDGDRLPFVPDWTASATVDYTRPLRGDWEISAGGGIRVVSDRVTGFSENPLKRRVDGYTSGDLYLQLANGRITARAFAKNIGNGKGAQTITVGGTDADGAPLLDYNRLQPRTIGLALDFRF